MVLSLADAAAALPLDTTITLGGKSYHSHWLGGCTPPYGDLTIPRSARYGLVGTEEDASDIYSPGWQYVAGPIFGVTVNRFADALVDGGWKFYSASGLDDVSFYMTTHPSFGWDYSDLSSPFPVGAPGGSWYYLPFFQHLVWCDLTSTTRSGAADSGQYPEGGISGGSYALYRQEEGAQLAVDLAGDMSGSSSNNAVVIAIDGSGSFGSGSGALTYLDNFLAAFGSAKPGNDVTLVVTKFSDYGEGWVGPGDLPAIVCGRWTGISSTLWEAVSEAVLETDTGNGGDTNESQIEGIYLGMQQVGDLSGDKAIVVYTDAASVILFGQTHVDRVVRQYPRDDALGLGSAPRIHPPPMASRIHGGLR